MTIFSYKLPFSGTVSFTIYTNIPSIFFSISSSDNLLGSSSSSWNFNSFLFSSSCYSSSFGSYYSSSFNSC